MNTRDDTPFQSAEGGQALAPAVATPCAAGGDAAVGATESPRLVIRGETPDTPLSESSGETCATLNPQVDAEAHPFAALTDYLNIAFPFNGQVLDVRDFWAQFVSYLGTDFGPLKERKGGLHGWKRSFAFAHGKTLFAFGGQNGTAFLSFPGEGCALIPDWRDAAYFFEEVLKGRITRWDGAVDDFEGQYSVDQALTWYREGQFNIGRKPSYRQVGPWDEPTDEGRTFYVGARKNGKLIRIYEKGKQLGDGASKWVRWELELHNVDRLIPFDVLLEPGRYVAGAYPCTKWIRQEASRIRTFQKSGEITYAHLSHFLRIAYGRMINVMMEVEGNSERVIELLRLPGSPARLDPQSVALLQGGDADAL